MTENSDVCPPIIALGKKDLYLHAAETVDDAVSHAHGRFPNCDLNAEVDFFDATGRRLELNGKPSQSKALPVIEPGNLEDHVREQVRSVIERKKPKKTLHFTARPALEELLRFLDESQSLEELAGGLEVRLRDQAALTSVTPAATGGPQTGDNYQPMKTGSWLHNFFCH